MAINAINGLQNITVSNNGLDTITITGPDLSPFATKEKLNAVSGTLQTQIDGIDNHSRYTDTEAVTATEAARASLSGTLQAMIDAEILTLRNELLTVSDSLQAQIDTFHPAPPPFSNNSSMQLDGVVEQLIRFGVNSDDIGSNMDLTLNFWVKTESNVGGRNFIFYKQTDAAGDHVNFVNNNENRSLVFESGSGTQHSSVNNVWTHGQWHMVTVEINNVEQKFYVDGQFKANAQAGNATDLNPNIVGDFNVLGPNRFKGVARHLSIHQGNFGATMIQAMYNSGTAIDLRVDQGSYTQSANLRHYWFMGDDGDDLTVTDGVIDRAGSLHLTAQNMDGSNIVSDTPHA
ncbi:hypothetical protein LCGC14_2185830 [marine sediment metagenome]|uniref:LamG-like jellyroll fold domain-containing protein n=1 Tax=marine sediment metagenome TaxID=412755 RepID=A0A0F9FYE9_9ZZZZ